jgi:ubiquinone/menaquinone biosynthesis C-methylase UbiE/uncharacterized protein YbaR (Trm112 family)
LTSLELLCPVCRSDAIRDDEAYRCPRCARAYPVIYGIPDFRLQSDAYLDLEAERAKARKLAARAPDLTFEELIDYYYSITDDVPAELAAVYKRSIVNGPEHLADLARDIDASTDGTVLDVGCGSGSLLLALAKRNRRAVGMDIALRWLVICRKRLTEEGVDYPLVCGDILLHPLAEQSVSGAACIDLLEHTQDMNAAVRRIRGVLRPGGRAWFTVSNRYTLGPHAATRLWGIGFLPKRLAGRVCRALRGVDSLRHIWLTTPREVAKMLDRTGFSVTSIRPRRVAAAVRSQHRGVERLLIRLYRQLCRWSISRRLLIWIGPVAEIEAQVSMTHERIAPS